MSLESYKLCPFFWRRFLGFTWGGVLKFEPDALGVDMETPSKHFVSRQHCFLWYESSHTNNIPSYKTFWKDVDFTVCHGVSGWGLACRLLHGALMSVLDAAVLAHSNLVTLLVALPPLSFLKPEAQDSQFYSIILLEFLSYLIIWLPTTQLQTLSGSWSVVLPPLAASTVEGIMWEF